MHTLLSTKCADEPRPVPVVEALPVGLLGLSWRRIGERQTWSGPRLLWITNAGPAAFIRLYRADRDVMQAAGFGWGSARQSDPDLSPFCWEALPAPSDRAYADACGSAPKADPPL